MPAGFDEAFRRVKELVTDFRANEKFYLVEQMLAARKQLAGAQSEPDKDFYTRCCDGLARARE